MADVKVRMLEIFELYLATAEKVSDRRAQANSWMLSVNNAIVGLYGYLQMDKTAVSPSAKDVWLWALPSAGVIVCLAWVALLASYRKLNRAKFEVLMRLEADLPMPPFTLEQEIYRGDKRSSFSQIEIWIPGCFAVLYTVMFGAAVFYCK
jgi:hypothetical protein